MTGTHRACPLIEVHGQRLPGPWESRLVDLVVESRVNMPATARLSYSDGQHRFFEKTGVRVGGALTVAMSSGQNRTSARIFDGEVTAVETSLDRGGTFAVVHASDCGHRLQRGREAKAYGATTLVAAVREAAGRHGLRADTTGLTGGQIPYLVRPNLTDWELLTHLAEERGLHLAVDGETVTMRPLHPASQAPSPDTGADRSVFVLERGVNLRSLRAAVSSVGQVSQVRVTGWNPAAKAPVTGQAPAASSPAVHPSAGLGNLAGAFGGAPQLLVTGPYSLPEQADTTARALADRTAAGAVRIDAQADGAPQLRAGVPFTLRGAGAPFTGQYTATSCRHTYDREHGYLTDVQVGPLPAPVVPPPPPLCARGVAIGLVTDIREPGQGRRGAVRVKLPWLSDSYESDWMRTVQWGGSGGGGIFVPEVGDEVLVAFEHGRLDRPYVIGGLYNGKDEPSSDDLPLVDPNSGRVNRRSIAARTGDRVELLSTDAEARGVRLRTGDGKLTAYLDRGETSICLTAGEPGSEVLVRLDGREAGTVTVDAGEEGTLVLRGGTVRIEADEIQQIVRLGTDVSPSLGQMHP
ncbi:VgrG-related protein [Streptomyces sp. NPDC048161]|uniref:VgrG-related protein n=1 Tax=Streptomyces sp. NPDC048161 TaxID=3160985 RepID=UPI00340D6CF2